MNKVIYILLLFIQKARRRCGKYAKPGCLEQPDLKSFLLGYSMALNDIENLLMSIKRNDNIKNIDCQDDRKENK